MFINDFTKHSQKARPAKGRTHQLNWSEQGVV